MKGVPMSKQRGRCLDSGDDGIKPRGVNLGLGFFHPTKRQDVLGNGKGCQTSTLDRVSSQRQNKDMLPTNDSDLPDICSIFSTTPIVQPAREHDFTRIFSSTPVVQPIKSAQVPLPFQKCSFRNINSRGMQIVRDKSIFRGKAIV